MSPLLIPLAEAAKALSMSETLLRQHVKDGSIRYVSVGRGVKNRHLMFTPDDLKDFIQSNTRRGEECHSRKKKAAGSGATVSGTRVITFQALREQRTAAKQSGLKSAAK